ncbi:MAG: 16S rRNA (guanine(527)-N(7))-methyltransferase RsmG [Rickettsiales bacterium]|nr:16S rRNA (guanine(527)-N(7))-methyltransferase RsmG [Rickettsiales bacterium]
MNTDIFKSLNVSRETFSLVESFVQLLLKWNKKINLISRHSSNLVWQKHIIPSAQLIRYINIENPLIMDVGSGAGFPGIILAIIKGWQVILVEKSKKKCVFLKEVQSLIQSNIIIENNIIEETKDFSPDIITSRGVTTISKFLKLTNKLLNSKVKIMLMKGDRCQDEVNDALNQREWQFDYEIKSNSSEQETTVVILSNFKKL